ncbi:ABC transporter permease [Faecalicatena faecalis]|nr:ABC transporter permease [Faecalicatena faecalis]
MATFVLTGISIWGASESAQLGLRQSLGASFEVAVDWSDENPYLVREPVNGPENDGGKQATNFLMYSTKQLNPEQVKEIRQMEGVKYCDASVENLAAFEQLSLFAGKIPIDEDFRKLTKVLGVWGTEENELFASGTLSLVEGRHLTQEDTGKAVICLDLAEKSGVGVGDYLTTQSTKGKEIKVQIVGLFAPAKVEGVEEMVTSYDKIQNRIFTDLDTAVKIEDSPAIKGFSVIHVTVEDPQDMERIVSEVQKLSSIDWDAFTVTVDNEAYEKAAQPLKALGSLIVTLLTVIVIVSVIILALILTLWTKTRIHEIGVFLSVGMKKSDIIGQFLVEVMMIAVLAFGLSFFTSSAIAGQIGNQLLEQSRQNGAENQQQGAVASDPGGSAVVGGNDSLINSDTSIEEIQVSVGLVNLAELYLIGFAVIIAAVGVSSVTVMRLKPREILSKMS